MAKIIVNNPRQVINGGAKKYYFKVKGLGGPKGDKGDKGDTGSRGPQGEPGNAATVYVGSTTTLPVGQDATVENVGTQYNAVLNFGIPQGPRGPQGVKGDPGEPGQKGEPGPRGVQGERGTNATVYIGTTTTLNPGSQATVYNSGTGSNAVLNFGIPKGEKGDTGATGATGATGPAGQDGQNFTPTIVDSLPATGEEGKLYLTPKAHTTQTATGNPITATVAEDAGAIESFQLDGDTFQQTYEGKNLFDVSASLEYKWLRAEDGLVVDSSDPNIVAPLLHVVVGTTYVISGIGDLQFNLFTYSDDSFSNPVRAINNSRTRRTFTATTEWLRFSIGGGDAVAIKNDIQFEVGSTATTYEPYVGGIPSPNPEYPQPIHTVTGEQTVEIQGKNLFDATATPWFSGRAYDANGEMAYWSGYAAILGYQPVEPNSTYTFSNSAGKPIYYGLVFYDADKNKISNVTSATPTFTTPANCHYVRFAIQNSSAPTWTQLELGSTATDYAPYFKQTLPLDLGTIELHSLDGNYLDRIFKDGNDWKIHKATASDRMSSADNWVIPNPSSYPNLFQAVVNRLDLAPEYVLNSSALEALCEELTYMDSGAVRTAQGFAVYNNEGSKLVRINHAGFTTVAQLKDWLSNNNVEILFALAIPTDTIITDTTLIAQLEAIRTALLQNGTNTITNTATGSNLAGDMEIGYYGFAPRNRYDKWLWLDINNEYEQIGS